MAVISEASYGAWSTGKINSEMIDKCLDHYRNTLNSDDNFILEN
jgi:hypothetical protein